MMLDIRDLTCGYGKDPVLRDVSVSVGDGEFVAIIGPNGSGKTTLLRAISKVVMPRKGTVLLDGKDIRHLSFRDLARRIAVVTNLRDADLNMCVEDFVLLGRIPHRKGITITENSTDRESVHKALALTDTLGLKRRRADSLSSGEKQMVYIARALAQEPRLLLLDEPTSHLDITHQVRVLDLIRRLNRERALTVITVLHDLNLAGEYCDRLFLLKQGSKVKDGTPGEVLTYEIIEDVYGTPVIVLDNPASGKPHVFLVSEENRAKQRKVSCFTPPCPRHR
jgi:iron complex transport system ATP-binding protein